MATEKREKRLYIRVSEDELILIKEKANSMGLRLTTYLRMLLKRGKLK